MTIELGSKVEESVVTRPVPFYPEVVGEVVHYEQGSFKIRDLYLRGWWPKLGTLAMGLSGRETVVRENSITSVGTFTVTESDKELEPLGS